jgi:hypothetical protein
VSTQGRSLAFVAIVLLAADLAWAAGKPGGPGGSENVPESKNMPESKNVAEGKNVPRKLQAMLDRYAKAEMSFDARPLPAKDKQLLKHLIAAGKQIDAIFWRQSDPKAVEIRDRLARAKDPESQALYRLVLLNAGPFDRFDEFKSFTGSRPAPPGAGFYPEDLTKEELDAYFAAHPEEKERLLSPHTLVRRAGKKLVTVPYHVAYAQWIEPAARELEAAAALSQNASFTRYLRSRAKALRSDDFFASDCDWIDLRDTPYELVFGPFEVYDDRLMGVKATYEASVAVRDAVESDRLKTYVSHLQELEDNLPYPEQDRRKVGTLSSPMVVVRDIYRGGDLNYGYQAVATNLPNDPRVHEAKGSKKIFWKNVMDARVNQVILPISRELLVHEQAVKVTPRGVFEDVLMHEISHALGPRYVRGTGEKVPVNERIGDLYSPLEEMKATVAGLVSMAWFFDHGVMPADSEEEHYASYLGGIFRSVRFGASEAHGRAGMVELNFGRERGAIRRDAATGRWSVVTPKMRDSIRALAEKALEIERAGDRSAAGALFAKYGSVPEDLQKDLDRLRNVPIEIEPIYKNAW